MTKQKIIKSDAAVISTCQSRVTAIQTNAPSTGTISCAGTPYTQAALVGIYQKCITTRQVLENLRHQEEVALLARDNADATRKAVDPGLLAWAVNTFGPQSQQAKDLGYVARTPTPPTTEVKAAATAKAKATREARGTGSQKAQKAITPAPAPAPAASPAPEPATPGTPTTPKA
ncbi:MAG TPA: hypothetical protein VHV30_01235 [Polyangiaceae bacterium]|nr:hypothetical protein [Polyangiaceae bacterium]